MSPIVNNAKRAAKWVAKLNRKRPHGIPGSGRVENNSVRLGVYINTF
jgi:hypothetical protein